MTAAAWSVAQALRERLEAMHRTGLPPTLRELVVLVELARAAEHEINRERDHNRRTIR